MAKVTRNSGKFQQDATMSMLARDARGVQNSTAVATGLQQGQANAAYAAQVKPAERVSFKFLATGK